MQGKIIQHNCKKYTTKMEVSKYCNFRLAIEIIEKKITIYLFVLLYFCLQQWCRDGYR